MFLLCILQLALMLGGNDKHPKLPSQVAKNRMTDMQPNLIITPTDATQISHLQFRKNVFLPQLQC